MSPGNLFNLSVSSVALIVRECKKFFINLELELYTNLDLGISFKLTKEYLAMISLTASLYLSSSTNM